MTSGTVPRFLTHVANRFGANFTSRGACYNQITWGFSQTQNYTCGKLQGAQYGGGRGGILKSYTSREPCEQICTNPTAFETGVCSCRPGEGTIDLAGHATTRYTIAHHFQNGHAKYLALRCVLHPSTFRGDAKHVLNPE